MSIAERTRMTQIHLEQQREENILVRNQIEEARQSSLRSKTMLDEATQLVTANESHLAALTKKVQEASEQLANQKEVMLRISEEIECLGPRQAGQWTGFALGSHTDIAQDVLDVSSDAEVVCFKDSRGQIWEIVRS